MELTHANSTHTAQKTAGCAVAAPPPGGWLLVHRKSAIRMTRRLLCGESARRSKHATRPSRHGWVLIMLAERVGFEPTVAVNHTAFRERHLKPLGHLSVANRVGGAQIMGAVWSWWPDSNRRPADYESAALPAELHQRAGGQNSGARAGIRTRDLSVISRVLWPTELPSHVVQMGRLELPPGVVTRHGPEPCASANSATSAAWRRRRDSNPRSRP